ncbi:MAG TPA: NAD(P)-dependent oxidoreductase [Gemmataceae bacterium]|nr:NAD(P)-dependent oxidoreductase [Gemmataceae bacterium]
MNPRTIGLVGLGLLGGALAERFLGAGYSVIGFDLEPGRRRLFAEGGGQAAASSRDVARSCDRLVLCLPDTSIVESVLAEIAPELRDGLRIIDTTTGDPEQTAALGAALSRQGIRYLDATVSGSSEQVRAAQAVVMVGGDQADSAACADLFACFASQWYHVGPWGSGAKMKLVVNLVLGLNRAALAEGLALARACGLDLPETLRVLQAGAAYSRVMDAKGRKMIERDFQPQARLSQHRKDVRLILAQAERVGAKVPLSALHFDLLGQVEAAGGGAEDNSAIIRAFD